MLRCHTGSPKGKDQNLLISNSVSEIYLPDCRLYNQKVHRFLNPLHLPTPALTKRLSLIFLWEEFSRRAPIPIVNPLQYTVCICWSEMGCTLSFGFAAVLHYLSQNRPSLLVLTCWQLRTFLGAYIMSEVTFFKNWKNKWWVYITLKLFIYINMCCILPNDLKYIKWRLVICFELLIQTL